MFKFKTYKQRGREKMIRLYISELEKVETAIKEFNWAIVNNLYSNDDLRDACIRECLANIPVYLGTMHMATTRLKGLCE